MLWGRAISSDKVVFREYDLHANDSGSMVEVAQWRPLKDSSVRFEVSCSTDTRQLIDNAIIDAKNGI